MISFITNTFPCFTPSEKRLINQQYNYNDQQHASSEKPKQQKPRPPLRYSVNMSQISNRALRKTFVQSHLDHGTAQWLQEYCAQPSAVFQAVTDMVRPLVGRTNANGLTGMGSMFVLSAEQTYKLFCRSVVEAARRSRRDGKDDDDDDVDDDNSSSKSYDVEGTLPLSSNVRRRFHMTGSAEMGSSRREQDTAVAAAAATVTNKNNGDDDNAETSSSAAQQQDREEAKRISDFLSSQNPQQSITMMENFPKWRNLLDIGSGDGDCTRRLAPFFSVGDGQQQNPSSTKKSIIAVTEDSPVMRARLSLSFGFSNVYTAEQTPDLLESKTHPGFDCISLLNVLDRCDEPLTLLKQIRQSLVRRRSDDGGSSSTSSESSSCSPSAVLLLAVVLPWCPFVERGAKQVAPSQALPMGKATCLGGATFEQSLDKLVTEVLEVAGFRLLAWTRVPYMSQGDAKVSCFALDDAVMVLEPV